MSEHRKNPTAAHRGAFRNESGGWLPLVGGLTQHEASLLGLGGPSAVDARGKSEPATDTAADVASLRCQLPERMQAHQRCAEFLQRAAAFIGHVRAMQGRARVQTPAQRREQLQAIEDAAHRIQNDASKLRDALEPLAGGTRLFSSLNASYRYLAKRAVDRGLPGEDRPAVPALGVKAEPLSALLSRVDEDLRRLRTVCAYAVDCIDPVRSETHEHKRYLVRTVASILHECFGEDLPERGWFGNDFMPEVGKLIGMKIGHRVVGEVVKGLHGDHAGTRPLPRAGAAPRC